jgi:hypothetical protein
MLPILGLRSKSKNRKEKREMFTPRFYARVFGVLKHELRKRWDAQNHITTPR